MKRSIFKAKIFLVIIALFIIGYFLVHYAEIYIPMVFRYRAGLRLDIKDAFLSPLKIKISDDMILLSKDKESLILVLKDGCGAVRISKVDHDINTDTYKKFFTVRGKPYVIKKYNIAGKDISGIEGTAFNEMRKSEFVYYFIAYDKNILFFIDLLADNNLNIRKQKIENFLKNNIEHYVK